MLRCLLTSSKLVMSFASRKIFVGQPNVPAAKRRPASPKCRRCEREPAPELSSSKSRREVSQKMRAASPASAL